MKLRNLLFSTIAAGSMLAAAGCTELNVHNYAGNQDGRTRPDTTLSLDSGVSYDARVDVPVVDTLVPDTYVADAFTTEAAPADLTPDTLGADMTAPDALALDKTVADLTLKDQKGPDNKFSDSQLPDSYKTDFVSSDQAMADTAAPKKDGTVVIFKDGLTGDVASTDSGKGCTDLSQLLNCLEKNYQTLVAPGWNVYVANQNNYKSVITDETKFKQGVASGNPCSAPKTFTNQTCIDYLKKETPGNSIVKLEGLNKVMITGYLPNDQAIALEALANGKLYKKACVINGSSLATAKITCL